jgi:hypothetical protein
MSDNTLCACGHIREDHFSLTGNDLGCDVCPCRRFRALEREPACRCGRALPPRARVRTVLDGALSHLNRAKLCDATLAKLPLSSIRSLAMMAHATLRASSMLERCEQCLDRELERAAVAVAQRQLKGQ